MLETLTIRGFRGFESYRLTDLTRVNLLVGKNNCGKTSVLEAIELLACGGHPSVFLRANARRCGAGPGLVSSEVSHMFFGHECVPGASFELSSGDTGRSLSVRILPLDEIGDEADAWLPNGGQRQHPSLGFPDDTEIPVFGLCINSDTPQRNVVLPITAVGSFPDLRMRDGPSGPPVHFHSLESLNPGAMGGVWDIVVTRGIEAEVVDDMRTLEPDLESIHFLTSAGSGSRILVGLRGGGHRLPIESYGGLMRRLLAMRLSIVGAENGLLLIDGIDTGLHWTVMEDMWQFVVDAARRSNVQIFATTHSYDCIRRLGSLLQSRPDLNDEVSIQKLHGSLTQAACLRGDEIRVAVEQDIEVR